MIFYEAQAGTEGNIIFVKIKYKYGLYILCCVYRMVGVILEFSITHPKSHFLHLN